MQLPKGKLTVLLVTGTSCSTEDTVCLNADIIWVLMAVSNMCCPLNSVTGFNCFYFEFIQTSSDFAFVKPVHRLLGNLPLSSLLP